MKKNQFILLLLIIGLAAFLRFTGLNWDNNAHLHPDERFLTMVTTSITWPTSISQYFDTNHSPANPHNKGFSFYVYGTYPMYLTKLMAQTLGKDNYNGITLVGRALSATMDIFTLIVIFLITKHIATAKSALFASFCYAIMVLPIQLSHFYTVDPYAVLFLTISLYLLVKKRLGIPLGIAMGLAIAGKVSSVLMLPLVALGFFRMWREKRHIPIIEGLLFLFALVITVRITYPYLFVGWTLNPLVLGNWDELKAFDSARATFPPALQWIGVPAWKPTMDLIVLGLGSELGVISIIALMSAIRQRITQRSWHPSLLLIVWIILIVGYQSFQFTKAMRYFWPIYPAVAILIGTYLSRIKFPRYLLVLLLCTLLLWPISFLSIYLRPHTRITANTWIYTHIPAGSVIAWEHWDDPMPFSHDDKSSSVYQTIEMPVFNPDGPEKRLLFSSILSRAEYIILASNRGYGAIRNAKLRFPKTNRYYEQLFDGSLGFTPVAQFTSRPTLNIPGIRQCIRVPGFSYGFIAISLPCRPSGLTFQDDFSDETWTVYDHPQVTIFQKKRQVNYDTVLGE